MLFRKTKDKPDYYLEYLEKIYSEGFSDNIIALDVETDGLKPRKSDILSFGSVYLSEGQIEVESQFYRLFSTLDQNQELIKIHELISSHGDNDFENYLPQVLGLISNKTILGHFIDLDISFINHAMKKKGLGKLKNPVIDTLKLALKKDGVINLARADRTKYTLYALCNRYDIDIFTTHNALEDAYLTAMLYLHLKD